MRLVGAVGIEPKSYNLKYFGIVSFEGNALCQIPGNTAIADIDNWYQRDLSRKVCK
jgi:hypothetical protein